MTKSGKESHKTATLTLMTHRLMMPVHDERTKLFEQRKGR